jgi:hypothetical protein
MYSGLYIWSALLEILIRDPDVQKSLRRLFFLKNDIILVLEELDL